MSRQVQGTGSTQSRHRRLTPAAALLLALSLAGCGGGFSFDRIGPDRSLVTGSVARPGVAPDGRLSDEAAIRSTVAAWMPGSPPPEVVPWVNSNTGSTGAIARVADSAREGALCRTFSASRESFDGVSAYDGKACSEKGGAWTVLSLERR